MSLHRSEYGLLFPRFTSIALKSGSKRKNALTNHCGKRGLTPFASATKSASEAIFVQSGAKRNLCTVINPGARTRSRLPILHAVEDGIITELMTSNGNYSSMSVSFGDHRRRNRWRAELRRPPSSTLVPAKNHP